jgi:hypothetical protein
MSENGSQNFEIGSKAGINHVSLISNYTRSSGAATIIVNNTGWELETMRGVMISSKRHRRMGKFEYLYYSSFGKILNGWYKH